MSKLNQPILINVTVGAVIKIVLVLLGFYTIYLLSDLFLALVASVVIASAVEPATQFFVRRKIPRALAVIFIYLSTLFLVGLSLYFFIPTLLLDLKNIISELPNYLSTLSGKTGPWQDIPFISNIIDEIIISLDSISLYGTIGSGVSTATIGIFSIFSTFFGGILSFVLILVLSFYLSVQEDGVSNFLRIITPAQNERYVLDLWKRSRRKIGLWMQGQLLLGVLVGVLTYLGLSILGVENAFFLAVIAGAFELIPIFGPIFAAVPAIAIAIPQGGLTLTLMVMGLYLIIQQFESQLIHPLVVKKIVGIPALIAIVALFVGAQLAGFIGIILSVPIAAALMEYLSDVEKRKIAELALLEKEK
jgi:predicted PurR-regulated permease PerM